MGTSASGLPGLPIRTIYQICVCHPRAKKSDASKAYRSILILICFSIAHLLCRPCGPTDKALRSVANESEIFWTRTREPFLKKPRGFEPFESEPRIRCFTLCGNESEIFRTRSREPFLKKLRGFEPFESEPRIRCFTRHWSL